MTKRFAGKTIVVTFLMHLGDLVLTTPFLHVLRKAAQDSRIVLIVDEKLKDIVVHNPNVDVVLGIDKKGEDKSIWRIYQFARRVRENYHPDMVINLHKNERASFLAWAIGAPIYVGASHRLWKPFMDQYTDLKRSELHAADMYVDVLAQLGVSNLQHNGLEIHTTPEWEREAEAFYESQGIQPKDRIIGFNIGSAVPEKRWPVERFAKVAKYFADQGYTIVFFGGPMDQEMVAETVQLLPHTPVVVATGQFTLGPLAAAIRRCALMVTNDSGPMHIAVSQHVPLVTLYGPSNPRFYGPYTNNATILQSTTEYDTGKSMKEIIRSGSYQGLAVISVEEVIQAVEDRLKHSQN